ncbi:winged helix DNA-binding domain-containing protein, partial [Nocardia cyriacigeorgica]
SMVVLHATDPATVFLSVAARGDAITPADIERALYEDRSLLRMLAMRRTMFVAPVELVPVLQASCADALADKQRRTYGKFLEQAGIGEGDVRS